MIYHSFITVAALLAALAVNAGPIPDSADIKGFRCPLIPQSLIDSNDPIFSQGNNTNLNPDPTKYTFTVLTNFGAATHPPLTHGPWEAPLDNIAAQIPNTPSDHLLDEVFYAASGGYSFVVKQAGDRNLVYGNVGRAVEEVRKALKERVQTTSILMQDPQGQRFLEGWVGFYDTETLGKLQECMH